jgi:tetratricopeptide (TPR) repeat protein
VTVRGRPPPGAISALLAELAHVPELDPVAPPTLAPGQGVGRFELVRELGRGGFGRVFEARDPELRRPVALKLIRPGPRGAPDPEAAALLQREAEAVAQLQHPNIVTLHDVGVCAAGPFLVLELLRGESLAERLRRGPLPVREALAAAVGVCRALAHAHRAGVLHRDLKPGNVFLVEGGPVKVLDFGLARAFGRSGPARAGTPGYMAPEQREGRAEDERTDVFALGLLLHEALGGAREAEGEPRPLDRPGIPPAVAAWVARATDPLPVRRPESAGAALEALLELEQACQEPAPAPARPAAADRLEAHRHYVLGQQCARYPAMGQDCGALLRRAVALDPDLAPAQYELAVWLRWFGGTRQEQEAAVGAALRNAGDAPERERRLIEAWAAQVSGRDAEALAIYRQVVSAWPGEVRAWYHAGDLLRHRDELAEAVPWLEQALALDPEFGWAAGQLADALGALGRREALCAWVGRWERAQGPSSLHGLSVAHGWLGDLEAAASAGERAVAMGGGVLGQEDRLAAVFFSGRFADAEREVRPLVEPASPVRRMGYYALAALQAYQGRRRAGLATLDAFAREIPAVRSDSNYHAIRADYLVGDGDLAAVRAEVEALEALDPQVAAEQAVSLCWLGDVERAAALARRLPPGSPLAGTQAALAAWHGGAREAALEGLRRICARTPVLTWRVAPIYLLGELLLRDGRDAEGLEVLRRFEGLYVWRQMWRSWAWPRAQLLMTRALLRLGDRAGAACVLERLLGAWREAEPGEPLLAEVRALREDLEAPGSTPTRSH